MRIKDYLGLNEEEEAGLKAISTFPEKKDIPQKSRREIFSPLERAMVERISLQAKSVAKDDIPYPAVARLFLSYTCTHSCSGCLYGFDRKGGGVFLDLSRLRRLLDSLHFLKVGFIELRGGGEPTTHPEFREFAQTCIGENFDLSLLSNGTWLDSRIAELLGRGFSYLTVNLDASDDKTYNRIHHPPEPKEFQRVLGNIERVVTEREKEKSNLIIGAEVRLGQTNMNFMEQITCLARDMGMDYVRFRINRRSSDRLLPDQVERLSQLIPELRNALDPFPVYGEVESADLSLGCRISPAQLTIDPGGDVYPCPHFARLSEINSFGNILTQPADELWFGPEHRRAAEELKKYDCSLIDCRWHIYRDIVEVPYASE